MSQTDNPLLRLLARALGVSVLVVAISIALIGTGVSIADGFWRTLLLSIASAGLSIGGIGLLYEAYLRRTQTQDVLALVRLERDLADAGIKEITKRNRIRWQDFFRQSRRIVLLPVDPLAWANDEWPHVLDSNLHESTRLEIYLPQPDGTSLNDLATRVGTTVEAFRNQARAILAQVEREWKEYIASSSHRRARLRLLTYDGIPGVGFAIADNRCILTVPGVFETNPSPQALAFRFETEEESLIFEWVTARINTLSDAGLHYSTPED